MENNKQIFADNLRYYMKCRGVTNLEVAKVIEVPTSTFSNWTMGLAYPRIDKLQKLADYFGITKADLVEEKKSGDGSGLTKDEYLLLSLFQQIPDDKKQMILNMIRAAIDNK